MGTVGGSSCRRTTIGAWRPRRLYGRAASGRVAPPVRARHFQPRCPKARTTSDYRRARRARRGDPARSVRARRRSCAGACRTTRCGRVRHRPRARHGRRSQARADVVSLYADGVNVHAMLFPRTEFRKTVEGSVRNSFMHSLLAKGRLLYTHDETIADVVRGLHGIGDARPPDRSCLRAATTSCRRSTRRTSGCSRAVTRLRGAVDPLHRDAARADRGDQRAAARRPRGHPAGDDAQPGVVHDGVYRAAQREEDGKSVQAALDAVDAYMAEHATTLFAPVLDHLREVGEAGRARDRRALREDVRGEPCHDGVRVSRGPGARREGVDARAANERSNVDVQELAFYSLEQ